MIGSTRIVMVTLGLMLASGCGSKTRVPPRIDLSNYEVIGVIDFEASKQGELGPMATRRFIEEARRDQGLVRVLELGSEANVLQEVGEERLGPAAYRAMAQRYGIHTLFTGELLVSDVRPAVRLTSDFRDIGMAADVDATLTVNMIEASSGASIWNRSGDVTTRIGGVSVLGGRDVVFDADDPERAYGEMVDALVHQVTWDFRVTWR